MFDAVACGQDPGQPDLVGCSFTTVQDDVEGRVADGVEAGLQTRLAGPDHHLVHRVRIQLNHAVVAGCVRVCDPQRRGV